jgi:hypothetical protein
VQDIWNTTWYPKAADHVTTEKTWYVVDAEDKILGRMASAIAVHMRGKNEPTYTPSVDMGAFVIVVCIFSVVFTEYSRILPVTFPFEQRNIIVLKICTKAILILETQIIVLCSHRCITEESLNVRAPLCTLSFHTELYVFIGQCREGSCFW